MPPWGFGQRREEWEEGDWIEMATNREGGSEEALGGHCHGGGGGGIGEEGEDHNEEGREGKGGGWCGYDAKQHQQSRREPPNNSSIEYHPS